MAKQPNNNPKFNPQKGQGIIGPLQAQLAAQERLLQMQREINEALGVEFDFKIKTKAAETEIIGIKNKMSLINQALAKYAVINNNNTKKQVTLLKQQLVALNSAKRVYEAKVKTINMINTGLKKVSDLLGPSAIYGYLMDADKAIKSVGLELGYAGDKANDFRKAIQGSATYAANLGVTVDELAKAQKAYADESSRTLSLTQEEFKAITNIGKGTAIGVEGAGKLTGQFQQLGLSVEKSATYIQDIKDSSERMGINTTKVLKVLGQNFKTLNTFSFRDGIKGMAKMAEYSEKFKLNINDSINSAKMARSLEGAIEMASQLNVLGGEFAKSDPFELLFLSRNDPAEYTKKLAGLTKGMATLKKTEDGFQLGITPQDQDRLRQASEALGVSYENMTESAMRFKQIQMTRQDMLGMNLTSEQKEYIEGISKFSDKSGKMYATINGIQKNISQLTGDDVNLLKQQKESLADAAKRSQTFDDVFKNTIMELKSSVLPILEGINSMLATFNKLTKGNEKWVKYLGVGAIGLITAGKLFTTIAPMFKMFGSVGKGLVGGALGKAASGAGASGGGAIGGGVTQMAGKGGTALASNLKAIGFAAAGAGVGIGAAAAGFGYLAQSLKGLDAKQLDALKFSVIGISIAVPLMAGALVLLGKAAETSVVGIGIITIAMLGIGAAIGMAGAGIGYMAKNLGDLSSKTDGAKLLGIAGGLTAIAGATLALAGGGIAGLIGGGGALAMIIAIGNQATNIEKVGRSFKDIGVVLNTNASQIERVEKAITNIANSKFDSNSIFAQLSNTLSKPLQVEFKDKNITIRSDVTLEIDGNRIAREMDIGKLAEIQTVRRQQGNGSSRSL